MYGVSRRLPVPRKDCIRSENERLASSGSYRPSRLAESLTPLQSTWGAPRVHGELLMPGFDVFERTVSRMMPRRPADPEARQRFLESIAAGLADAEAGKVIGTAELKKHLRAWRTERARG